MKTDNQGAQFFWNTDWAKLYFTAESERESFQDIQVVTAKSEYVRLATMRAFIGVDEDEFDTNDFQRQIADIINNQTIVVHEFVDISARGIVCCIDVEAITDDTAGVAIQMIAEALDRLDGKYGVVNLSKPLQYKTTDIPWFYKH